MTNFKPDLAESPESRQAAALESIAVTLESVARSLFLIANPMIILEQEGEEIKPIGGWRVPGE